MRQSLAADRVYLSPMSPWSTVSSYLTPFTLTSARLSTHSGGIVSVALSLGSPPVAVSNCRILCCPDFPPAYKRQAITQHTALIIIAYLLRSPTLK